MKINSELDAVIVAAQQLLRAKADATAQVRELRVAAGRATSTLAFVRQNAPVLIDRLRTLMKRAGLVRSDEEIEHLDLENLQALALELLVEREGQSLPENVVVLPMFALSAAEAIGGRPVRENAGATLQSVVHEVLSDLSAREQRIVRLRYGIQTEDGKTLKGREVFTQAYIANRLGVSQATVSISLNKALRKLRWPGRSERLRPYWENITPSHISIREQNLLLSVLGRPPGKNEGEKD